MERKKIYLASPQAKETLVYLVSVYAQLEFSFMKGAAQLLMDI